MSQGSQGNQFARQMWQNQAMRSSSRAGSRARGGGAGPADNNKLGAPGAAGASLFDVVHGTSQSRAVNQGKCK